MILGVKKNQNTTTKKKNKIESGSRVWCSECAVVTPCPTPDFPTAQIVNQPSGKIRTTYHVYYNTNSRAVALFIAKTSEMRST